MSGKWGDPAPFPRRAPRRPGVHREDGEGGPAPFARDSQGRGRNGQGLATEARVTGFRVDLHVHTARYSACAECLPPRELAVWALHAGLHGVVITEHDVLWEEEELAVLQAQAPELRVFRGIECTVRGGHLLIIGLSDAGPLVRGAPLERVAAVAHEQGAAVILAHPFRDGPPTEVPFASIDATEVMSTSFSDTDITRTRRLARKLGLPQVGASDAHALARIGWAATELSQMPNDERELAEMIRRGLVRPRRRRR